MIYDKYGKEEKSEDGAERDRDRKKMFKKCNSLKNLKNRNTCDEIDRYRMKRQASSPYLRSASINNVPHSKKSKPILSHTSPEKILKLLQCKSKDSLTRSLSKKNLKHKNVFNPDKSQNSSYSKPLKKRSTYANK